MFGEKILLLIPHPDDEVVGCCGAIGRARAQMGNVFGFYLTTGIPPCEVLWWWQQRGYRCLVDRRQREAEQVAELLKIKAVEFQEIPARTLKGFLGPTREKLLKAIRELGIDTLWAPAYEGGNQDHDVANFLARTLEGEVQIWEFSEYHFFGGRRHSNEFFSVNGTEWVIRLEPGEQQVKRKALSLYRSERSNLKAVRASTTREVFRPLAKYDYSRPPYRGRMFYQRFQRLVPAHPRIDYCEPEEVCQAFHAFLTLFQAGQCP